ncbi:polyadenylation and cleavage factor homolog 4-like isoform X2 [Telopea speciosissima]|uniref:polyadenylation and cleavage factor homolog 4-like isoform X2 n=1 Tax=Telopea speciosissima TaxID=54955 RepID=UPI001CC7D8E8|nr:polyadenylation and cleavage factor homolog 4-like isoform X2 [Telopea speciosissima]
MKNRSHRFLTNQAMEKERFVPSRENPRDLGFLPERGTGTNSNINNIKGMPNDIIQKPLPPILDRFRALLREREEELRVSDDDDVPALSAEEIVRLYEVVLSELTFNSKPLITELTIIAGDQREYGEGIAAAICARILEAPVDQKLPSLYLLDSIVKNIGREYARYFASHLPEVFCEAYRQVHSNLHPPMRHLFGTWSAVFPPSVLRKIEAELKFSSSVNHPSSGLTVMKSSESPFARPTHGIHVNPKYLEARHQFEHSTVDVQHARGGSSSLQTYGQKSAIGYNEYDIDNSDVLGAPKLGSPVGSARESSVSGVERPHPSKTRLIRPSSPSRIGLPRSSSPPADGFRTDNSPGRVVERDSPSRSGFDSRLGRAIDGDGDGGGDGERTDWWKFWSNDNHQHVENSSANLSNGSDRQRPRALIDAYGNCKGKKGQTEKPIKVDRLDVNGINSETATRWQNTDEEEFVWEDMSPTLADRRSNDPIAPNPPLDRFNGRASLGRSGAASLEHDFRKGNWPSQSQLAMDDTTEDGVSILGFRHGSMIKNSPSGPGTQNETTHVPSSHYTQEPWILPHHYPQSSQQNLDLNKRARTGQLSYPAGGMAISAGQKLARQIENFPDSDAQHQRFSSDGSRIGSSSPNSLIVEPVSPMMPMLTLEKYLGLGPHSSPLAQLPWPPVNVHRSQPLPLPPILSQQKQIRSPFYTMDVNKPIMNQVPSKSSVLHGQRLDASERKAQSSSKLMPLPNQQIGLISLNQRNQGQAAHLQRQLFQSKDAQENYIPFAAPEFSSHLMARSLNQGHIPQGHGPIMNSILSNPTSGFRPSSVTLPSISNNSFHLQGGALPPLPPGPPPASSQMGTLPQNLGPISTQPPTGSAFSGLISSLMAQGLISMTSSASIEDSVGVDFNPDLLKVRYESAIKALYADLPRQCTACGLRFKCQEEHSSHMDWHVTRNRISKNRKQKPSRKWFVSTSVWLSGAEAVGTDAVPGFLPTEVVAEKRDDEEMAVPADENQNVCALCGEPFDDFYSDETEEWMYKGAVYLNAPDGLTAGIDISQLGPIVHAKCRSESTVAAPEDFVLDEGGDKGNQRKKMRS